MSRLNPDEDPKVNPEDDDTEDQKLPPVVDDDEEDEDKWDHTRGMSTIRKLREEIKGHKTTIATLKPQAEKAAQLEREQMSESDKLKAERDEAKEQVAKVHLRVRQNLLESETRRLATKLGFIDDDVAVAMIASHQIEFDEDDRPIGVEGVLKSIAKDKPKLIEVADDRSPRVRVPGSPKPTTSPSGEEVQEEIRKSHAKTGRYAI